MLRGLEDFWRLLSPEANFKELNMELTILNFYQIRKVPLNIELKAAAPFSQKSFQLNAPYNPKKAKKAAVFSLAKPWLLAASPVLFLAFVYRKDISREIALFKQIMAMNNTFGEI